MFNLDYILASPTFGVRDYSTVSEDFLHYSAFPGDIIFTSEDVDFSARWGWVPILDFAICWYRLAMNICKETSQQFGFTESAAFIRMQTLDKRTVLITTSYAQGSISIAVDELQRHARTFLAKTILDLCVINPTLEQNPTIVRLKREINLK